MKTHLIYLLCSILMFGCTKKEDVLKTISGKVISKESKTGIRAAIYIYSRISAISLDSGRPFIDEVVFTDSNGNFNFEFQTSKRKTYYINAVPLIATCDKTKTESLPLGKTFSKTFECDTICVAKIILKNSGNIDTLTNSYIDVPHHTIVSSYDLPYFDTIHIEKYYLPKKYFGDTSIYIKTSLTRPLIILRGVPNNQYGITDSVFVKVGDTVQNTISY